MKKITLLLINLLFINIQAQNLNHPYSNKNTFQKSPNSVTDWLHYDNGINKNAFGNKNDSQIGAYIKLTPSLLAGHINRQIEEIKFYLGSDEPNISNFKIEIYTNPKASPVYSENISTNNLTAESWNTITLATPYVIDGSELYVGYIFNASGYNIVGVDDGSNFISGVNYYTYNGSPMKLMENNLAKVNLNLQVGIGGPIPNNDAGTTKIDINNTIIAGSTNIKATITNYGSNTLNNIDFNYTIDGGNIKTDKLTNLNLARGESITLTHSIPWDATSGKHNIDVFISNFNGNGSDEISANDHQKIDLIVLNEFFNHNVVYEESTATWCGWCVRGIAGLKDMYHYHNDGSFIGIAVHSGDPMSVEEYDEDLNINALPNGKINRNKTLVDPSYKHLEANYLKEKATPPMAKIEINNMTWNKNSREITAEITTTFALDIQNINYNASLIIVENNVSGTSSNYAQHNYYHSNQINLTDWEGINYANLPDPIPASQIVYNHVARALIGGFDGVFGSIPTSVTYNTPYTYTFSYTLPANINEHQVHLIAVIIDNATKKIINGTETDFSIASGPDNINQLFAENNINIYPNPISNIINISGANNMHITIYDIQGKKILEKDIKTENEQISLKNLDNGMYFIQFKKDNLYGSKKFIINH